jgi:hypothetical protein
MSALHISRPPFTPREIFGTHFRQRLSRPQWWGTLNGLGQLEYKKTTLVIELEAFRLALWSSTNYANDCLIQTILGMTAAGVQVSEGR